MRRSLTVLLVLLLSATPALAQTQPQYISEATGEGLEWTLKGSVGGAHAAIDGTKVKTLVHGAQRATLEVKARIDDASGGATGEAPWLLAIAPVDNTAMACIMNGAGVIWTGLNLPALGPAVFQCVWDTTQASASARVRLYIQGASQGNFVSGTAPAQNATIDLGTGKRLNIGNHDLTASDGESSIDGRIYYAAVWNTAMSAADALASATALLADDDAGGGSPGDPTPGSVLYAGEGIWQASSTVATLTPGLPSGLVSTDHVFALVAARTTGTAPAWTFPTLPTGQDWELIETCHRTGTGGSVALEVWVKNGDAPTSAPAITINDLGFGWSVVLVAWRNTPGPVDAVTAGSDAVATWVAPGLTTINANTRVASVVAAASDSSSDGFSLPTPNGYTERLTGSTWATARGPHRIGMADFTQGDAGAIPVPTWGQAGTAHPWCGVTLALDLILAPVDPPPPQGGVPVGIPRFEITDRPATTNRPAITDRPVVNP